MILGAHTVIYSTNADADRAFLKHVLKLDSIDAGGGWLIFAVPVAELAVHPSAKNDVHELYLLTDDVVALVRELTANGAQCTPVQEREWGLLTQVSLPGGGKLNIYQPRHARPILK